MEKQKQIDKEIENLLKYYEKFRTELWLLMIKFEETTLLKSEFDRIIGKIEALKELKKIMKKNEKEDNEEKEQNSRVNM